MKGGRESRGGFALALVVFMLFAVAVAGITGYQVVSNEMVLATHNRDSQKALSVARAGLQRFLGETVGAVGDSVSYQVGDGVATVTTRKVLEKDWQNHLYYVEAVGTVTDARLPGSPAMRTVATYAWHRLNPVPLNGALWVSGGTTRLDDSSWGPPARVEGSDHSTAGECPGVPAVTTAGVVKGGGSLSTSSGATYSGSPNSVAYPGFSAMYDTVGVRWDILSDANFPVDFDGVSSGVGFMATDSFPIVRYDGDLTAYYSWSGQGVLIVTGTLTLNYGFEWNGIILAGRLGSTGSFAGFWPPIIRGMLIAGLEGSNPNITLAAGDYLYEYCDAFGASRSLSYLEVVDDAFFEVNG